jgi:uncharacterized protein YcbX
VRPAHGIGYGDGVITLTALNVYPVKSCRGIALDSARVTRAGLEHDREWMIVTPEGRFLTQREEPRLARIGVALTEGMLVLSADGAGELRVPLDSFDNTAPGREAAAPPPSGRAVEVTVWRDHCRAIDEGGDAAEWLTALLGHPLRLVRFDPAQDRPSDPAWTGGLQALNRFSDGFALLAISAASLADLNERLASPLPMNRFRPNLVLEGLPPYGEDAIVDLAAGDVRLRRVKPCTRCIITTTDQASGVRVGDEPMRTLKSYRWDPVLKGVTFGQNFIVVAGAGGRLGVGMELRSLTS